MGLDSYVRTVPADLIGNAQVDISTWDHRELVTELAYWRRNYPLHTWMRNLYNAKGGDDIEHFANTTVRLMPVDIDQFTFDAPGGYRESDFTDAARVAFSQGLAVYYYAAE